MWTLIHHACAKSSASRTIGAPTITMVGTRQRIGIVPSTNLAEATSPSAVAARWRAVDLASITSSAKSKNGPTCAASRLAKAVVHARLRHGQKLALGLGLRQPHCADLPGWPEGSRMSVLGPSLFLPSARLGYRDSFHLASFRPAPRPPRGSDFYEFWRPFTRAQPIRGNTSMLPAS